MWALGMNDDTFRPRCASALIHPATVTALAVLLLNDLVFKSIWPGSWATGKLSDLAWVVFASPLLAFLLSFLAGRSACGQRAAFLTAYVGLPLLYAAFNTFQPVHDSILQGISIASGGTAGSPLDATDSVVIPFGLGIALWVWRGRVASPESLRLRWTLLIAGVAALASVATSYPEPDFGIRDVGISADGEVYGLATDSGRCGYLCATPLAFVDLAVRVCAHAELIRCVAHQFAYGVGSAVIVSTQCRRSPGTRC